ncbi:MAG: hypothetical protein AAGB24_08875 [Bacteroidota bacterium]
MSRTLVFSVLLVLTILPTVLKAQLRGDAAQINTSQYNATRLSHLIFKNFLDQKEKSNPIKFSDIKGTPYMPENFVLGSFSMKDEKPIVLLMRYNMYDDEVEVNEGDGSITSFLKVDNTEFNIQGNTIRPYTIEKDGIQKKSNFIVLADGANVLLLQRKVVLIPAEKAINPNQMDRAAKFVTNERFFVVKGNDLPLEFSGKKKDLFTLFPEKAPELKDFIKTNKLSVRNNEHLVQIFNYLNENS